MFLFFIQAFVSTWTVANMFLISTKKKWAPIPCVLNEIVWIWFILYTKQYGLLIMSVSLLICWIHTYIKWNKEI